MTIDDLTDVVCARCGTSEDMCAGESVLCKRCQHPDHVRTLRFWAAMYDPDEPVGIYQPDADYYHALSAFDLRWAADEIERLRAEAAGAYSQGYGAGYEVGYEAGIEARTEMNDEKESPC